MNQLYFYSHFVPLGEKGLLWSVVCCFFYHKFLCGKLLAANRPVWSPPTGLVGVPICVSFFILNFTFLIFQFTVWMPLCSTFSLICRKGFCKTGTGKRYAPPLDERKHGEGRKTQG